MNRVMAVVWSLPLGAVGWSGVRAWTTLGVGEDVVHESHSMLTMMAVMMASVVVAGSVTASVMLQRR